MTVTVPQINAATNVWSSVWNTLNQVIVVLGANTVTVDSTANGSYSTGNGYVTGIFGGDTITVGTTLRGGNVQSSQTLSISSNTVVGNSTSNVVIGYGTIKTGNTSVNSSVFSQGTVVLNTSSVVVGGTSIQSNTGFYIGTASHAVSGFYVGSSTLYSNVGTGIITVGNSTVNSYMTANSLVIGGFQVSANALSIGNTVLSPSGFRIGDDITYVNVNSSSVVISPNTALTGSSLTIGVSSVTSSGINVGSSSLTSAGLQAGVLVSNSTGFGAGNVVANTSALAVGNTGIDTNHVWNNQAALYGTFIQVNDGASETYSNSTIYQVGNSTVSSWMNKSQVSTNLLTAVTGAFSGSITIAGRSVDSFPSGTRMLFQQSTAPTGWVKDTTYNDAGMRIVSGSVGAVTNVATFSAVFASGSTGSTALTVDQMPSHQHTYSGTTGGESVNHTHNYSGGTSYVSNDHTHNFGAWSGSENANHYHNVAGGTDTQGYHAHGYPAFYLSSDQGQLNHGDPGNRAAKAPDFDTQSDNMTYATGAHSHGFNVNSGWTSGSHQHYTSGTTGGVNSNHTHTYSGTTTTESQAHVHGFSGTTSGSGSGQGHTHSFDMRLNYVDFIICQKS